MQKAAYFSAMKGLLKFILLPSLFLSLNSSPVFAYEDIEEDYKYAEAVDFLTDLGIVQGYEMNNFYPYRLVSRAEMLKIVLEAFYDKEFEGYKSNCFSDIEKERWESKYVCFAKEKGIVAGYNNGKDGFKPSKDVNFVEGLKMLLFTFGYEIPKTDPWYKGVVDFAAEKNLIPPDIYGFDQELSRGQMVEITMRLLKYRDGSLGEYLTKRNEQKITFDAFGDNKRINERIGALLEASKEAVCITKKWSESSSEDPPKEFSEIFISYGFDMDDNPVMEYLEKFFSGYEGYKQEWEKIDLLGEKCKESDSDYDLNTAEERQKYIETTAQLECIEAHPDYSFKGFESRASKLYAEAGFIFDFRDNAVKFMDKYNDDPEIRGEIDKLLEACVGKDSPGTVTFEQIGDYYSATAYLETSPETIAFAATRDGENWFIVKNGVESEETYQGILGLGIYDNEVAYVASKGNEAFVYYKDLVFGPYDAEEYFVPDLVYLKHAPNKFAFLTYNNNKEAFDPQNIVYEDGSVEQITGDLAYSHFGDYQFPANTSQAKREELNGYPSYSNRIVKLDGFEISGIHEAIRGLFEIGGKIVVVGQHDRFFIEFDTDIVLVEAGNEDQTVGTFDGYGSFREYDGKLVFEGILGYSESRKYPAGVFVSP